MLQQKRISSIDLLRGLAACAVMLFHFTIEESIHLSDDNLLRIIGRYGHYGVEVFFIISGFIIPWSMYRGGFQLSAFRCFLLKRCTRIEIPYLSIILIEVLLIYISSLTPWRTGISDRLDILNLLSHIVYLNELIGEPWLLPVFWTLAVEFQFYILIALLFGLLVHKKAFWRLLVLAFLLISSFLISQRAIFFHHSNYFVLGILIFLYKTYLLKLKSYGLLSIAVAFTIYIQVGLIPTMVCFGTIGAILFFNYNWKWSRSLGVVSYSIYLVHIPVGGRLLVLTQKFVHDELIRSCLIILYVCLTILVAWGFYKIFEKPSLLLSEEFTHKSQLKGVKQPIAMSES